MAKRKPWRRFKEKRLKEGAVRRICLAVLAAELGVLWGQGRLSFPVIEVTKDREVIIYQFPGGNGDKAAAGPLEAPLKDEVYGIRIRLKEGMVDFYRREELHRERP